METTRLSDLRFFTECIDTAIPALADLPELAQDGQIPEAITMDLASRMAYSGPKKFWNV